MHTNSNIKYQACVIRKELCEKFPQWADDMRSATIRVSNAMTRTSGSVVWKQSTITLSLSAPFFKDPTNFRDTLFNTVTHELAHVIAGRGYGHGLHWKWIHAQLGGNSKRCHNMSPAAGIKRRLKKARIGFACPKCDKKMSLGPTQAKRFRAGVKYSHGKCPA